MPEGDTIYRTALNLRAAVVSESVTAAKSGLSELDAVQLVSRTVTDVESRGKHLLIHFDNGSAIHSHMGMTGSWHIYKAGEQLRNANRRAAIRVETSEATIVCFAPKVLEILTAFELRRHRYLSRLGPDILSNCFSGNAVLHRMQRHASTRLGEALMNQTIVCGIGNVYKSEMLFLARLNPFRKVSEVTAEELLALFRTGRRMMRMNLNGYPRRTRFRSDAARLWVYRRAGESCLKCDAKVQMRRQGDLGRSTYWCPACQQLIGKFDSQDS